MRPTSDRVREAMFDILGSICSLDGARVVDLYAGSGALGLEALSRGAAEAVFVESDPVSVRAIRANLLATVYAKSPKGLLRQEIPVPDRGNLAVGIGFPDPSPSPEPAGGLMGEVIGGAAQPPSQRQMEPWVRGVPGRPELAPAEPRTEVVPIDVLRWIGRIAEGGHECGGSGEETTWFDWAFVDPPYAFGGWAILLANLPADQAVCESRDAFDVPCGWATLRRRRYGTTLVTVIRRANPVRLPGEVAGSAGGVSDSASRDSASRDGPRRDSACRDGARSAGGRALIRGVASSERGKLPGPGGILL